MKDEIDIITLIALPALAAAAGYGGSSMQLRDHEGRLTALGAEFNSHKADVIDRLARMETKIDLILHK